MNELFFIILFTFLVSLISFIGALSLFLKEKLLNKALLGLVAFSAGTLIGGAFLHLLPEAISEFGVDESSILNIFLYTLFGFVGFYILENYINWHHHHSLSHPEIKTFSYLILFSDALHNFIDGLIIAASFLTDFSLGIVATSLIVFHEIPQEIGDFAVLVYSGFGRWRALFFNFFSGLTAVLGGLIGYFLIGFSGTLNIVFLPLAAGAFIYIGSSDLIPEIKDKTDPQKSVINFLIFLSGILLTLLLKIYYNH